ncbi:MAG: pyridoxal-phosphate dependent enzyme [Pontiellaceae bacterium]|nr:pyridoxal-phosphate dependent enzyme [Pontiellaceae bacterium]
MPTPITPLHHLAGAELCNTLSMKRDDLSGAVYGGNKIRKLEFLLGEALAEGRKSVITYGAAGSNHALATAVCCREVGLHPISILAPQETSEHVRKNILMGCAVGAELHLCRSFTEFPEVTKQIVAECRDRDGVDPYIIPAGGSNAVGALGFVNAAFELAEQTLPDIIYLPMGTGGTLAGLLVGLKLAGLKTHVEAVRVVNRDFRDKSHIQKLCSELCTKLNAASQIDESDIHIRDEFLGSDYGIPTPEGKAAVELFRQCEHVELENTYTGKTAAALLHDLNSGTLEGKSVLYWNTLNSRNFSKEIEDMNYRNLPDEFHSLFQHRTAIL